MRVKNTNNLKRKCPGVDNIQPKQPRVQPSLLSPPMVPPVPPYRPKPSSNLAVVPGCPQMGAPSPQGQDVASQEDEWKNIKVVRYCFGKNFHTSGSFSDVKLYIWNG